MAPFPPNVFVPVAEEIGIIPTIGDWVLRTALAAAADWPETIRISVNMSPLQFRSPNLPAVIANAIASAGISADRLEIELTEGVFIAQDAEIDERFATLKALGIRFALDDFGTGYASLANLKRFPFDTLKIDRSFVRGLSTSKGADHRFIAAIVALAESLGLQTVAEGAETTGEVDVIRSLGFRQAQGYIFGKAMSIEQAGALVIQATPPAERPEREARLALYRRGQVHSEGWSHPVRIRNISSGGAMIEIDQDARISNSICLQLSSTEIFTATVRWASDHRIGVAFDTPIDVDQLVKGDARST